MNDPVFVDLVKTRTLKIQNVLAKKAKEYARGDRLHNFKRAAKALNCTPERACISFWMKHVVSILDMVDDIEAGRLNTIPLWDEKIGDAVNYLILLEGLVVERLSESK